ncbi:hypothetical protein AAL_02574 [Moelleriella libera RCEF 2490]|uniref:CsbD-like protein n=1 Tax=Moelleriella libera RCEF 2490 TaxID=1081109 RepID=A0A168EPN6_9HYPO|nr:hypothetical protein AAL_02574 [Moelleriella libera RCEF 2490]
MSDKQATSTLQSYVDSATGAVQSAIGSITGNTGDKIQGDVKQDAAKAEHKASHTAVKVPGATISSDGGASKDDPDRAAGSWNQTVGSAKETVGGLIGSEVQAVFYPQDTGSTLLTSPIQNLKSTGRQQNLEGQGQEAKGQASDLGAGVASRVQGTIGGAVTSLTGDKEGQAHYDQLRADGKAQQRGVEHDVQKKAEAEAASKKE